jgi:serine protease
MRAILKKIILAGLFPFLFAQSRAQWMPADNQLPIRFEIPQDLEEGVHFAKGRIYFKLKEDRLNALSESGSLKNYLESISAQSFKLFPQAKKPERKTDAFGRNLVDLSRVYVAEFSENYPVKEVMTRIKMTGTVDYVHPNFFVTPENGEKIQFTPNDPQLSSQWHIGHIGVPAAWDVSTGSSSVIVGLPDGGTNFSHADLQNIAYNTSDPIDGVDNDGDGWVDNNRGWNTGSNNNNAQYNTGGGANHGVAVSGLASATVNNTTDGVGISYQSPYLPIKIVNSSNQWSGAEPGVFYAAEKGAKVINCSWGNTYTWPLIEDVTRYAIINKGCLMVASAGNSNNSNPFWPASLEGVLCVAGTDITDVKSASSSFYEAVDISAPGVNMFTTSLAGFANVGMGTSWAAPVVSGASALIFSAFPGYTPEQVTARIKETSFNHYSIPGNAGFTNRLGKGRIDVGNALNSIPGPSIYMTTRNWADGNDGIFTPGESISLSGNFTNWLNASSPALSCSLSASNPNVTVNNAVFTPGIINTLQVINNNALPFTITISPSCPPNTIITFTLTFTDGAYTDRQYFSLAVNQNYINLTQNQVHTSIAGDGRLGYADENQLLGLGLRRNGNQQHLLTASLVLADSPTRVSDATLSAAVLPFNSDFSMMNAPKEMSSGIADHETATTFTDDNAGANKLNVKTQCRSYAWNTAGYDQFVILEYTFINQGGSSLSNLFSGIYSYYENQNAQYYNGQQLAQWDASRKLGYAYNAQNPSGALAGVKLLSYGPSTWYAFNNDGAGGSILVLDGFSDTEKFNALSGAVSRPTSVSGSVSGMLGTGPLSIPAGDSVKVAFALVLGNTLADLQNAVDGAQQYYDQYFGTWTGAVSTNWSSGGNWLSGSVPAAGADVRIPDVSLQSGNFPIIASPVQVNKLHILPNAQITVSGSGFITTENTLTNQGTFTIENNGALLQTVSSPLDGSGNFLVKRNLPTSDRFHYIGSPVNNAAVGSFGITPVPVNGSNGDQLIPQSSCNALSLEAGSPWCNLLELRENANAIQNCSQSLWHIKSAGTLENGRGYAAMAYTGSSNMIFSGTVNNGSVSYSGLGNSGGTITDPLSGNISRGWHLVANPYPSPITFGTLHGSLTAMGFGAQIQVWDAAANTWIPSVSNAIIPAFQGFQIRNSGSTPLNFQTTNALRTSTNNTFYSMPWENYLTVSLENETDAMQTHLFFHEDATDGYDADLEANRLFGGLENPVIYTKIGETEKMAFNGLAPLNGEYKTVDVGVYCGNNPGTFTLRFQDLNTLENVTVTLEDKKMGLFFRAEEDWTYSFDRDMNDSEDRFRIHLNLPDQAGLETSENWEFQIYPNPSEDYFRLKMNNQHSGFRGFLYDLSGKQINLFSIPAGAATHSLGMTDLSPGIYWLSLTETSGEKRRHVKKLTIIRN